MSIPSLQVRTHRRRSQTGRRTHSGRCLLPAPQAAAFATAPAAVQTRPGPAPVPPLALPSPCCNSVPTAPAPLLPSSRRWRCCPPFSGSGLEVAAWRERACRVRTLTPTHACALALLPGWPVKHLAPLLPSAACVYKQQQPCRAWGADANTSINCRRGGAHWASLAGTWGWGLSSFQMAFKSGGCYFRPLGVYKSLLL